MTKIIVCSPTVCVTVRAVVVGVTREGEGERYAGISTLSNILSLQRGEKYYRSKEAGKWEWWGSRLYITLHHVLKWGYTSPTILFKFSKTILDRSLVMVLDSGVFTSIFLVLL